MITMQGWFAWLEISGCMYVVLNMSSFTDYIVDPSHNIFTFTSFGLLISLLFYPWSKILKEITLHLYFTLNVINPVRYFVRISGTAVVLSREQDKSIT